MPKFCGQAGPKDFVDKVLFQGIAGVEREKRSGFEAYGTPRKAFTGFSALGRLVETPWITPAEIVAVGGWQDASAVPRKICSKDERIVS